MRFKKALCMTTLATLLFPVVQNIEYVDAAEYSIDIVVDTVEIDINDIPEDRCVKVGISLRNNPGMDGIFFPLEKDSRLEFFGNPPLEYPNMYLSIDNLADNIRNFSLFYGNEGELISGDDYICHMKFSLPENISIGDFFSVNILGEYMYKYTDDSAVIPFMLGFRDKDINNYFKDNFNITNGGIRIVGAESPQTESPQTKPPQTEPLQIEPPQTELLQTEPPQTELLQTEPPQTSTSSATSTTIESTTITTTSITTTTNESTVTKTENTTISTTSVTTASSSSSVTTTTTTETSEVTENKNDKSKNNLPLILAILASIGILGGIIGFIIKKSKGNKGK
ncbi:MAG: hypothetical protein E7510_04250 [Ruminococcus sp.]|nr:hypothetical protein [Ruminococcus sp.]